MRFPHRYQIPGLAGPRAFAAAASAQKTQLLVYTALETDQLKAYQEGFNKSPPRHRNQVGARLHRRHHRQAAGRTRPTPRPMR
jgi:hypothetical protein